MANTMDDITANVDKFAKAISEFGQYALEANIATIEAIGKLAKAMNDAKGETMDEKSGEILIEEIEDFYEASKEENLKKEKEIIAKIEAYSKYVKIHEGPNRRQRRASAAKRRKKGE